MGYGKINRGDSIMGCSLWDYIRIGGISGFFEYFDTRDALLGKKEPFYKKLGNLFRKKRQHTDAGMDQ